jgi:uncharacterized phiE125 gp8 family phage protein
VNTYFKIATAASTTPVSLDEAADHLRVVDLANEGEDLARKLREATEYCERMVPGRYSLRRATWDYYLDEFPQDDGPIELPFPPLVSITHVKYYSSASNTLTTLSTTTYAVHAPTEQPGFVECVQGKTWPATYERSDAVTIRCVVGSSTPSASVPGPVKQAIKLTLAHMWANRGDEGPPPPGVEIAARRLLDSVDYGFYR